MTVTNMTMSGGVSTYATLGCPGFILLLGSVTTIKESIFSGNSLCEYEFITPLLFLANSASVANVAIVKDDAELDM